MIRLMQYHLDQAKLSHRNMAATVECSCPHSDICNKQIDSNVYAIASGSKDDYLDHIYWQEVFRDVSNDIPSDIPQTIKASLQNAWADLLENIFGNISNQSTPIWGWLDQILTNIPHNHTAAKQSNTFISEKLTAGLFGLFSGFDNEATGTTDSIQERNLEILKTKKPRTTPKTV
ncbi:hypothetical protein O3M35_009712 [Rhynocoris fuscipes]|uniref:Uncharacterized protein n=1 Tax=Rhynocoris fuscipes TaxID=488301 RepID=A0AAW1D9U8_9HEMI